jgi:hypothetical protein
VGCTIAPVESLETLQVIGVTLRRSAIANGPINIMAPVPISGFPVEWRTLQQRARRH